MYAILNKWRRSYQHQHTYTVPRMVHRLLFVLIDRNADRKYSHKLTFYLLKYSLWVHIELTTTLCVNWQNKHSFSLFLFHNFNYFRLCFNLPTILLCTINISSIQMQKAAVTKTIAKKWKYTRKKVGYRDSRKFQFDVNHTVVV